MLSLAILRALDAPGLVANRAVFHHLAMRATAAADAYVQTWATIEDEAA